jgi:hypothetical protein
MAHNFSTDAEAAASNPINDGSGVKNYMDGVSFKLTPLQRLRFISLSSIRGETQYYRTGKLKNFAENQPADYLQALLFPELRDKTAAEFFDDALQSALDTDFWGVVDFALKSRKEYFMRLNPQVIMMAAAMHPRRELENSKTENSGRLRKALGDVAERPDDLKSQLEFYKEKTGGKAKLPGVVKRGWADRLEALTRYQAAKYKNDIIDLIRLSHPEGKKNPVIDELVKTGTVAVEADEMTWEQLRSAKKSWPEIVEQLGRLPHMAALRNLVGMAAETKDVEFMTHIMNDIKGGVKFGKQFPFRYYSAYLAVKGNDGGRLARFGDDKSGEIPVAVRKVLIDGLEECLQISMENFPKLSGDTISLCDNSGSAWGAVTSEYGSMECAIIANLSGLITAYNCTGSGSVGVFGDTLKIFNVDKNRPLLAQLDEINSLGKTVGGGTENGIWIFFRDALEHKKKYQNVFIYSDMQAGHGGLYGTSADAHVYNKRGFQRNNDHYTPYIDVMKLVYAYRKQVSPKTNFFSVQVAGYDNSVLPECIYRGAVMAGWTGKEVVYAHELILLWDQIEAAPVAPDIRQDEYDNME